MNTSILPLKQDGLWNHTITTVVPDLQSPIPRQ